MIKKIRSTSGDAVNIQLPASWEQLTQEQLHYIYYLRSQGLSPSETKNMFFVRLAGINPVRKVSPDAWICQIGKVLARINVRDMASGILALTWMDTPPSRPVRLDHIDGKAAVDALLHGISFGDWISLDNLYQGFILSKNPEALRDMAKYLYPGIDRQAVDDLALYNISTWYSLVKMFFARKWKSLFPQNSDEGSSRPDPEGAMNAMIRALTGGDVLKESALLREVDVWRALEELNQKAKEADEFKQRTK